MNCYWVRFQDRPCGSLEADSVEQATELASKYGEVAEVSTLPYLAEPKLDESSKRIAFCWKPEECKGHTACPRRYSCTE